MPPVSDRGLIGSPVPTLATPTSWDLALKLQRQLADRFLTCYPKLTAWTEMTSERSNYVSSKVYTQDLTSERSQNQYCNISRPSNNKFIRCDPAMGQ